jgi:hypothetical protein
MAYYELAQVGTRPPQAIASAGGAPTRVVARNTSAVALLFAFDVNDLSNATNTASCFRQPASSSDVFLLAPGQSLYATGVAAGGAVSVAISEAFPLRLG